jgi:hypothetical protein
MELGSFLLAFGNTNLFPDLGYCTPSLLQNVNVEITAALNFGRFGSAVRFASDPPKCDSPKVSKS